LRWQVARSGVVWTILETSSKCLGLLSALRDYWGKALVARLFSCSLVVAGRGDLLLPFIKNTSHGLGGL
jgi:hypothetical protein